MPMRWNGIRLCGCQRCQGTATPSGIAMNRSPRPDLRQTVSFVLRLAAVLVSLAEVWRSFKTMVSRKPPARPQVSALTLTAGAGAGAQLKGERPRPALEEAARKKAHEVASLQRESRAKALFHVAISAAKEWLAHRAASKGAALALYTLFSLAPMLLLVVMIAGTFFGEDTIREMLLQQLAGLMGEQAGEGVRTILAGAQRDNGGLLAGIVSAALVLISATSAFAELKGSLDELWDVKPSNQSGVMVFLRERVLSFGLILVIVLMLLISLVVSTALEAMESIWPGGEGSPLKVASVALSHLVSFGIVTGLFAVIFKYLPAAKIAWRDVFVGSLITAILFYVGKAAIGIYVANADISSGYGAAGSVVILITWVYYSAQIFFYGALFTHEYAIKLGSLALATDRESIPNSSIRSAGRPPVEP
jgi:membrane protein